MCGQRRESERVFLLRKLVRWWPGSGIKAAGQIWERGRTTSGNLSLSPQMITRSINTFSLSLWSSIVVVQVLDWRSALDNAQRVEVEGIRVLTAHDEGE